MYAFRRMYTPRQDLFLSAMEQMSPSLWPIIAAHNHIDAWAKTELLRYARLLEREYPYREPVLKLALVCGDTPKHAKRRRKARELHLV